MKSSIFIVTTALAMTVAAQTANAHNAGDILLRAGAAHVAPQDDSSNVKVNGVKVPGTEATVNDSTQLGLTVAYMLTDHIGLELLAATPFSHRIGVKGFGAPIDGKLGETDQLPPTLSVQYYPLAPTSRWQPYVGAGLNYTAFFNTDLASRQKANGFSGLDVDDSWGLALQVGSDFMITDKLLLNASVWYVDIDTTASARLARVNRVKVDVEVDPWVFMLGVGYKF